MNKKTLWILWGALFFFIIAVAIYFVRPQLLPELLPQPDPSKEIRATVVDFGAQLKGIDARGKNATSTIETVFARFVAPELLSIWVEEPIYAPIRYGTEPWPQRIEIQSLTKQKDKTYWVRGFVIEQDKTGDYTNNLVTIVLEKRNDTWLITDFSGYPTKAHPLTNTATSTDPRYLIPG